MKLRRLIIGIFSFAIVLLLMPLGHALMILTEHLVVIPKYIGAFGIGLLGLLFLFLGVRKNGKDSTATILGLLAGVLVWTGWIEFSFVWVAEKLNVPALLENGEVVTKPEYLIMPSSLGLLLTLLLYFLFTQTKCQFFKWFQAVFKIKNHIKSNPSNGKPIAVITFVESIMILWTFYLLLLLVYDNDIFGDNHPVTYLVAFGSLFWSLYLFLNLIKINRFGYAIRYAIPTVIIFWNVVEILGRWNLFDEIWIKPFEHWLEILIITLLFLGFVGYYILENRSEKSEPDNIV